MEGDDEDMLASLGFTVSTENQESSRVIGARLAVGPAPALDQKFERLAVVEAQFPAAAFDRLRDIATQCAAPVAAIRSCVDAARQAPRSHKAALKLAILRRVLRLQLGDDDSESDDAEDAPKATEERISMMQRKQAVGPDGRAVANGFDPAARGTSDVLHGLPQHLRYNAQSRVRRSAPGEGAVKEPIKRRAEKWAPLGHQPRPAKKAAKRPVVVSRPTPCLATVDCPLCSRAVAVVDATRPDVDLNAHIEQGCPPAAPAARARRERPPVLEDASDEEDVRRSGAAPAGRLRRNGGAPPADVIVIDDSDDAAQEEEAEDEEEEEEEEEEDLDDLIPKAKKRTTKTEHIVDDSDAKHLEHRLEAARSRGEVGESDGGETDDDALTTEGGLWLRASVAHKLFEHQRAAVRWLWALHEHGVGGIAQIPRRGMVGDEMGLGKTAQICAFLGALADGPRRRPRAAEFSRGVETLRSALILAPTTMLSHWHRELNRWAPKAKVVVLHRSATNFDAAAAAGPARLALFLAQALSPPPRDEASEASCVICVASFDSLHRLAEALLPKKWGYVVLDEGQRIRNPHARITQLCKRVRTARRLLLSGTPVQNSLQELWSLFDFCCPGRLGTLEGFDREMATPIRVGGYTNARPSQVELAFRCAVALRDLIKPYLLRRTKQEVCVGDDSLCALPAKTEHVLLCRLTNDQYDLYRNIVDSAAVRDIQKGSTKAFTAIMALRKICNHPDLYAGAPEDSAPGEVDRSSKLAALETVLTRWKAQKHRVLIFSQSKQMLDIIEVLVRACGWGYSRIDGDTQPASRQATADEFNKAESDQFVMLLTTRVGGVGLSLIGADRVVLFDPDWNPQTDAQARERAWRLGQKKPVTIYRMICAGTIEEKMYHRQIFKQALTNRVLADPKQRRLFSQSELADLFKLGDAARPHGYDGPIIDDREVAPADTELLANGAGVVDRHGDDDGRGKDDKDVLRALWSGGGNMASVFSHDSVVTSTSVQREAERQAKSAVAHLQSTSRSAASRRAPSSRELLAGPAAPDGDDGGAGDRAASELSMKLVRRINAFLASKATAPTTKELIAHFADVGDQNAPLFRSILRQLAQCRDGRWVRLR